MHLRVHSDSQCTVGSSASSQTRGCEDSVIPHLPLTFHVKILGLCDHNGQKAKFMVNPMIMCDVSDLFRREFLRAKYSDSITISQCSNANDISISYSAHSAFFALAMGQSVSFDLDVYFQLLRLSKYFESQFMMKRLLKIGYKNHTALLRNGGCTDIPEKEASILTRELNSLTLQYTGVDKISVFFSDIIDGSGVHCCALRSKLCLLSPKDMCMIVKSNYCNFPRTEVFDSFLISYIQNSSSKNPNIYSQSCRLLQFIDFKTTCLENLEKIHSLLHGVDTAKMYEYCVFPQFEKIYKLRFEK